MDLNDIMGVLNSPDGLKQMMMRPAFQTEDGYEFSQADLIADVVNILRMDTKRIAQAHGIDIEIQRMSDERAASLLQDIAKGDGMGLVEVFDDIEDKRMQILAELEGEDAVDDYSEMKQSLLNTTPDQAPQTAESVEEDTEDDTTTHEN